MLQFGVSKGDLKTESAFRREKTEFSVCICPKSFADERSSRLSQTIVFKCFKNRF